MTSFLGSFVSNAKALAAERGLSWNLPIDDLGRVAPEARWNLSELRGVTGSPTYWLSRLDFYVPALEPLNRYLADMGRPSVTPAPMPEAWMELYKAVLIDALLVRKNKPGSALENIGRYIRILSACAGEKRPDEIDGETVRLAFNVALQVGASGKYALNLATTVKTVFDEHHISVCSPLAAYCTPYGDDAAKERFETMRGLQKRETSHSTAAALTQLGERLDKEKLPSPEAFWELIRIIFTERPRTLSDKIRFEHFKLAIITGFRVGELVRVPADWARWREHVDYQGRSPALFGGISRSLMIRHFAEKQALDEGKSGAELFEALQYVPEIFAETVLAALGEVERITRPFRDRLTEQARTGRLFPDLDPNALVPDWDIYVRLSGSIRIGCAEIPLTLVERYRENHDPKLLGPIQDQQIASYNAEAPHRAIYDYFWRWSDQREAIAMRNAFGDPVEIRRGGCHWLNVGEVEAFARKHLPTKLPDLRTAALQGGGEIKASDFLFLYPTRSVVEDRGGGLLDSEKYAFAGLGSEADLYRHLGGNPDDNIFTRYGETNADKRHKIDPHALRHLQNAELFKLGLSDAIITKRFNRRSVQQSYAYDHRSLGEHLAAIDLPENALGALGPKAREALKLINSGRVRGPIVEEFRRIQAEHGDAAAFDYLNAESGGLHVTPYGFCLNSFAVDPCPKHLECFNACRHLARTDLPAEQEALTDLRERMSRIVLNLRNSKSASPGAQNQLEHAETRLAAIEQALATAPGRPVFPEGADRHRSVGGSATVLDGARDV